MPYWKLNAKQQEQRLRFLGKKQKSEPPSLSSPPTLSGSSDPWSPLSGKESGYAELSLITIEAAPSGSSPATLTDLMKVMLNDQEIHHREITLFSTSDPVYVEIVDLLLRVAYREALGPEYLEKWLKDTSLKIKRQAVTTFNDTLPSVAAAERWFREALELTL